MGFHKVFLLKRTSFRKRGECIAVGCVTRSDGFNLCGSCRKKLTDVIEYNRKLDVAGGVIGSDDRSKGESGDEE